MSFEKKETQSSESQNVCIVVLLFSSLGRQKSHNWKNYLSFYTLIFYANPAGIFQSIQ